MTPVEITLNGPVMENLCSVEIKGGEAGCDFHLDNEEVEEAREAGQSDLVSLIVDNMDSDGLDILNAAVADGSPVRLEGAEVPHDVLRQALGDGAAFAKA